MRFPVDVPGAAIYAVFGQKSVRVELYIDSGDPDRNQQIFDGLLAHRSEIEHEFGESTLEFDPCEDRRICKILVSREAPASAVLVPEVHDELREWFSEVLPRFVPIFRASPGGTPSSWLGGKPGSPEV